MQVTHDRSHTPTPAPAKQGRGTQGNSGQPASVLGQGKRGPRRQLRAESFAIAPEQRHCPGQGEPSLHPGWGGTRLHLEDGGQEQLCTWGEDGPRAQGLPPAPQAVPDLLERYRAVLEPNKI